MAVAVPVVRNDPHKACAVFNRADDVPIDVVYRFRVGLDDHPVGMDAQEAADLLHDSFAQELLLKGNFPRTGTEVLAALTALGEREDQLGQHKFFLVGEGSQIPVAPATGRVIRALRYLVTCGRDGQPNGEGPGPDILVSTFNPDEPGIELMAWDHQIGGFNFYRTFGKTDTAWVFTGNSRNALAPATRARGPFESHRSGSILMKELRAPWIHWHSVDAPVADDVYPPDHPLRTHPWFLAAIGDRLGAFTCETQAVRPSIDRWLRAHADALLAADEPAASEPILASLVDTPTVNITCSHQHGDGSLDAGGPVELPPSFFVDIDAFGSEHGGLGLLTAPLTLTVSRAIYDHALTTFDVHLSDGAGFTRPGDTFFAFAVPERAYEDHRMVVEARRIGLLSDRFAATILMVDFPNPIFSDRRASLLRHFPEQIDLSQRKQFSDRVASTIVAAATHGSAEAEFAELWSAGDTWREVFSKRLTDYLGAVAQAVQAEAGFRDIYRVAVSRRKQMVDTMPIAEFGLLFPVSDVEPTPVVLHADATAHSVTPSLNA
ncbi:hypothetical protein [Mycolicibacterium fluoranthenivorans]|uniref:Uncharacterized protein n=1 Tax=Mycolicibacterium fluoranthenivorans TaxID=258505 RepID=A0A1G4WRI8_9MYCO|nr:hypothetical protein [Mycolicibacterium fluoranthenivorans]SCX28028.1 hypothetical protein SAMN02799620_04499 [Mycolicibacterium fluoranthenivorans]